MGVVKIVPILFLLAVGCACAQSGISDPSEPTLARPAPREHRGFYNSVSFAFAYNWYNNSNEDIDYYGRSYGGSKVSEREIDYFEYNGFTFPLFEFKFGVALANLVAFHSVFNLGFYTGSLDYFYKEYDKMCSEDGICVEVADVDNFKESSGDGYSFRTFIGFGSTLYPFRDRNSPLNGIFVGGSFGYTVFMTVINDADKEVSANAGPAFQLELGKDWWVNDHLSIGVGLGFAHSDLVWETVCSHSSDNVISISFRLTRG